MSGANIRTRRGGAARRGMRAAFTLLEVLLASIVFGLSLMVMAWTYIGILQSLDAVKIDHALTEELRWLRERVLSEGDREALEKGGAVRTLDLGDARWNVAIVPTGVADVFQIQLAVEVGEGEKRHQKAETLHVLRPTWSEAVERGKIIEDVKRQIEATRREQGVASSARPGDTRGGRR